MLEDEKMRERVSSVIAGAVLLGAAVSVGAQEPVADAGEVQTRTVRLYFIAQNDNGKSGPRIGCGDSIIEVTREIEPVDDPITATLSLAVSLRGTQYGESGLYNALGMSSLRVGQVLRDGSDIWVDLIGTLALGGTCDAPRVEAQLRHTVMQFPGVSNVTFALNGNLLAVRLSGQGR
jgi:hypothetical protein